MLLTITTTHDPATDLGYLLEKHPARAQTFPLAHGRAHVFFPEARPERCTAALLLDLDPIELTRNARRARGGDTLLSHYVNDRPYVASSFLSVAIAQVLGSALGGRSRERPELAASAIPLEATIAALPCRGGETLLRRLFEPLGYEVEHRRLPLDETFPEWGESALYTVTLRASCRLSDLLSHLYVLVPVLDDDKHYWVGDDEVDKLLAKGEGWLKAHPEREAIAARYLKRQAHLTRDAIARLQADDDPDPDETAQRDPKTEEVLEQKTTLGAQRIGTVVAVLKEAGARRVVDLGCGEGRLVRALAEDPFFERIVGVEVSLRALDIARDRLRLDRLAPAKRARLELLHGSLVYRDARLAGYDAACAIEVIEHIDPSRLDAFAHALFEHARPRLVVVTTPNREHNVRFDRLGARGLRHPDHRFEWTRAELESWARPTATRFGYDVRFLPVGPDDSEVGPPTQLAAFTR